MAVSGQGSSSSSSSSGSGTAHESFEDAQKRYHKYWYDSTEEEWDKASSPDVHRDDKYSHGVGYHRRTSRSSNSSSSHHTPYKEDSQTRHSSSSGSRGATNTNTTESEETYQDFDSRDTVNPGYGGWPSYGPSSGYGSSPPSYGSVSLPFYPDEQRAATPAAGQCVSWLGAPAGHLHAGLLCQVRGVSMRMHTQRCCG
jgi:hypothetical protein